MAAQYLHIHPQNPQERNVRAAAKILNEGGIIIYPTDTIYGIGCDVYNKQAVEKICRIKQIDPSKAQLSFVCSDLSHLSQFTKGINTPTYRLLKEYLPGAYTFILPASKEVPKILQSKKSTIGLRIPNHPVPLQIVQELGRPILSASLPGSMVEDYTDPELMFENFKNQVDAVIDSGIGGMEPSTVVDLTQPEPLLIRAGAGAWYEND
jgi:tRNA threonylcarbamoyl adenosine modification protein (Sua5/YciO/YrdC/YwlC family)